MQKINLFERRELDFNLLKKTIAAGREKNRRRQFEWAIQIFDDILYVIKMADIQPGKKEKTITRMLLENLGDSYYAVKRYDAAFSCYLHSFIFGATSVVRKIFLLMDAHWRKLTQENMILGLLLLIVNKMTLPNSEVIKGLESALQSLRPDLRLYADIFLARHMPSGMVFENMQDTEMACDALIERYGFDVFKRGCFELDSGRALRAFRGALEAKSKESWSSLLAADFWGGINGEIYKSTSLEADAPSLSRYKCVGANYWREIDPVILNRTLVENINYKITLLRFAAGLSCHPDIKRDFERKIRGDWSCLEPFEGKRYEIIFSKIANNVDVRRVFRLLPSA